MQVYSNEERIKYLDVDRKNQISNKSIINYMQDIAVCHADSLGNGVNNADLGPIITSIFPAFALIIWS